MLATAGGDGGPVLTAATAGAGLLFALSGLWPLAIRRVLDAPAYNGIAVSLAIAGMGVYFVGSALAGAVVDGAEVGLVARTAWGVSGLGAIAIAAGLFHLCALSGSAGKALAEAAECLSLAAPDRYLRAQEATGVVRGVPVRLRASSLREVEVAVEAGLSPALEMRAERSDGGLLESAFPERVRTGDALFDREVFVRGHEAAALAFLDVEARRAVRELIARGASVRRGVLVATLSGDALHNRTRSPSLEAVRRGAPLRAESRSPRTSPPSRCSKILSTFAGRLGRVASSYRNPSLPALTRFRRQVSA